MSFESIGIEANFTRTLAHEEAAEIRRQLVSPRSPCFTDFHLIQSMVTMPPLDREGNRSFRR
jgi:hypothetical protein